MKGSTAGHTPSRILPVTCLAIPGRGNGSLSLPGVQTYAMIFSEDGDYIATANSDAKVRIFQTIDQSEVATLEGKTPSAIISLDFSPDGTLLAGGTADG